MEQDYETIDLREIFSMVKTHLLFIIAVVLVFAIGGALITVLLITPQYEASATMIVNTRKDQSTNVTNDQITSAKNLVSTYSIIIKSDTVLDPVREALQLNMSYDALQKKVAVSAVDSTQVMRISVRDPDPALAKSIVEKITQKAPAIIQEMVEAGSVKVISEARVGAYPVSPSKKKNVAIAALLGLAASLGYVFVREMFNNTFVTDEDVKKHLELVVVGVIPKVEG